MNIFSMMQYICIVVIIIAQIIVFIGDGFNYQSFTIIVLCLSLAIEIKGGDAYRDNGD